MNPLFQATLSKVFSKPAPFQSFSIEEILEWGKKELEFLGIQEAAAEAEKLLREVSGCSRPALYLKAKQPVEAKHLKQYRQWIRLRKKRIPSAYISGGAYFWNEYLEVREGCLIPRPETEVLVERFIDVAGFSKEKSFRFLDLGCGSGAIGIALLRYFQNARATFLDISEAALQITGKNLARYGLLARSEILRSDLFEAARNVSKVNPKKWDAIVSNPPYLSRRDWESVEPEIFFEPRQALDGGEDGLVFYDRILREAAEFLNPGGWLAVEVGQGQAASVAERMQRNSFKEIRIFQDYSKIERVLMGQANC